MLVCKVLDILEHEVEDFAVVVGLRFYLREAAEEFLFKPHLRFVGVI